MKFRIIGRVLPWCVLLALGLAVGVAYAQDRPKQPTKDLFDLGKDLGPGGNPAPGPATTRPANPGPKPAADKKAETATSIMIVADDFVADIFHNGKLVPADRRSLRAEIFGAQVEKVTLTLKPGDWVVFNVVNNRLRWKGSYYFAAAAMTGDGTPVYCSDLRSGNWSACDDLSKAQRFIDDPDFLRDRKAEAVRKKWGDGDKLIRKNCPGFDGEAIWGAPDSRSTWIKFVVPGGNR
ncbi:hypothetical protein [Humisphaera borealis]|uniref:TNase-like domain-containing protein n=1 Tax=Humisphaera borealis TaxID=2807512 RepID=A0A7M2X331_9BACT|nr:hypothetical protein [Humisphaera borealis]QOV92187.1 hypothetical protein IPV69_12865 [Humisphaera borealis]